MHIKELADLVGVTPRTIRHYHHEGLLDVPTNPGVREYTLDHAVKLVRIRQLVEAGLSLATVAELMAEGDLSLLEELAAAQTAIDKKIESLQAQKARLHQLSEQSFFGRDPLSYRLPDRLAQFYAEIHPHLDEDEQSIFEQENRLVEVLLRVPNAQSLIEDWLEDRTPERIAASVDLYKLLARLPSLDEETAWCEIDAKLAEYKDALQSVWNVHRATWPKNIQTSVMTSELVGIILHVFDEPNQQLLIRKFLDLMIERFDSDGRKLP